MRGRERTKGPAVVGINLGKVVAVYSLNKKIIWRDRHHTEGRILIFFGRGRQRASKPRFRFDESRDEYEERARNKPLYELKDYRNNLMDLTLMLSVYHC